MNSYGAASSTTEPVAMLLMNLIGGMQHRVAAATAAAAAAAVGDSATGAEQLLVTPFDSKRPPTITLHAYMGRIAQYSGCTNDTVIAALVLIDRVIVKNPNFLVTNRNIHRLLLTCIVVACKFYEDVFYTNKFYARVGGVPVEEMNNLEIALLSLLGFDLFITPEVYQLYAEAVHSVEGLSKPSTIDVSRAASPSAAALHEHEEKLKQAQQQQQRKHHVALRVDLTSRVVATEELPEEWYERFVGGEGVAMRWLCERCNMDPAWPPFDPRQPIVFATGPCTGTATPTSGRLVVAFRSPTTKTLGASNVGGVLAWNLKRAGWDMLIVVGKADKPVYICVRDDACTIEDATPIWGKEVSEAEKHIREKHGRVSIASCGPAGENLIAYASVTVDSERAAGRGGAGALLGCKNLKSIAVAGSKPIVPANPEEMLQAAQAARADLFNEAFVRDVLKVHGTPGFYDGISVLGLLPTMNWQRTTYPESAETLFQDPYHRQLEVRSAPCFGCPIGCGRHSTIKSGPWQGSSGGGPEFETLGAFGSKCGITDINAVARASHRCNALGLDTISCGQTIATAIEWRESGLLPEDRFPGAGRLQWGDGVSMLDLVDKIAHRDGPLAELLGLGVAAAAAKLGPGAEKAAMHVKGLELASCGVHASKGEAVAHATSARGGDHLRPYASTIDAYGYRSTELRITDNVDPLEDGRKGWVKPLQELSMATNMLGVCLFASITLAVGAAAWAKCLSAAVGHTVSKDELLLAAERVISYVTEFFHSARGDA
eukprot:TRINITY_DN88_c0_g4_i2.p1 TRINITY_DN88_c0_g4~~TRINITY_DN88_c0_g4_i2.p1  ORF type:complete len:772 (-),score=175.69 TRINITY_DN88_c0_g4_i2:325-2640(-)